MGIGRTNTGGGGGGSLNYKVVGGTSAPSSPKKTTIWVNTEVEITSHVFSATQPTSPVAGMVWFPTGASSQISFNALKKNCIEICPIDCKQYINGTWANKFAKTYQNGAWLDWWDGTLYNAGNMYADYTGGWTGDAVGYYQGSVMEAPTITKASSYMEAKITSATHVYNGVVRTANKIDVSSFKTLTVTISANTQGNGENEIVLYSSSSNGYYNAAASKAFSAKGTFTVDISKLTGSYYIGICLYASGDRTTTCRITKVKLEA